MKTGGIVISIIGIALFAWHLIRVSSNPHYIGYASHQVMSVNGVLVLVFGVTLYFIGRWRKEDARGNGPTGRRECVIESLTWIWERRVEIDILR